MAKKKILSLEEKLEEALIPKKDQPYELPENWEWVKLGEIGEIYNGNSINKKNKEKKYTNINYGYNYIGTKDINLTNHEINYENGIKIPKDEKKFKIAYSGSPLICSEGGNAGKKIALTLENICFGNKLYAFKNIDKTLSKFIFYIYKTEYFNQEFENNKNGLIGGVSLGKFKMLKIPIPPKSEQKRIVEKLEDILSKTNKAKELISEAKKTFKLRRASILHKAFTGELTKEWREKNSTSPLDIEKIIKDRQTKYLEEVEISKKLGTKKPKKNFDIKVIGETCIHNWIDIKLENLISISARIGWKGLKASEYTEKGPLFLSVRSLNFGKNVKFENSNHISTNRYLESPEIMLQNDDILLCKDGAGIGKIGIVKNLKEKATVNSSLLVIRGNEIFIPEFLFYYLSGSTIQNIVKERITGSAIPHLFQKDIKEFILSVPPLNEQKEIVKKIEIMLEAEEKAKELLNMENQIELLEKSILSKAFKGELGTNDINDEPAIELLKRVLEEE